MKILYDAEVDALYLEFRPLDPGTAERYELSSDVTGDYCPDGKLACLEILDAKQIFCDQVGKVALELNALGLEFRPTVVKQGADR
jgi:uncharacterized protein YuzE